MSFVQRREAELREKLDSVTDEFDEWRRLSATQELEKHKSQVARVTVTLGALSAAARERLEELPTDPGTLPERAWKLERTTLDLHRLWEFFRSKLALRHIKWYREALTTADELTWACYSDVQGVAVAARGGALKEPPLVFLNGALSPFAVSRGAVYEPERVPGEPVQSEIAARELRALPISVVGIPWFQLRHLPSAPVLCHEVGHNMEEDFALSERLVIVLEQALEDADVSEERRVRWRRWLGEVFGDVAGCAGTGGAFASALVDFLAADVRPSSAPGYPPTAVRVAIVLAALRELQGDGNEARSLEARWDGDFPDMPDAPREYAIDIDAIVHGLLRTKLDELDGHALADVLSFSAAHEDAALAAAKTLLEGGDPATTNARILHAAARKAFDMAPDSYVQHGVGRSAVQWIRYGQRAGPRALEEERNTSPAALEQADVARGRDLFARIEAAYLEKEPA